MTGRGNVRRSLGFAATGLARAWRDQRNFRVEVALAAVAVALGWLTGAALVPIVVVIGLVLALELVNSAVEALVDLVQPSHHELAKAAKDLAAAAVLVGAVMAAVVGVLVIGPPLVRALRAIFLGG
ncbi:MAG: diacylglycerol kinase [Trueperaceae bacterium]|nr:diacylglycerol kinase [Truepera sp.]HRQ10014.1 diacylglycerol kinase [Trueperaceae bacterium]